MNPGSLPRLTLLLAVSVGCSSAPAGSVQSDSLPLQAVIVEAESLYLRGQFDSAKSIWVDALDQNQAAGDGAGAARVLTWLGLTAYRQGDYAGARGLGDSALRLKQRLGLSTEFSRSYNALGLLAWNQGRLSEAVVLFDSAATTALAVQDAAGIAKAQGNQALVQVELGDFPAARTGFAAMGKAGRTLGDPRIEGNAYNNLGMLDIRLGDPAAALRSLAEARRLYRSIGYETGEQNTLGQLATAFDLLGNLQAAFAALDSALVLCRRLGLKQEEASNLQILAGLHAESGDWRGALRFHREAAAIDSGLGLKVERATSMREQAAIHVRLGQPELATRLARSARILHRDLGVPFEELRDLLLLAELAHAAGRRLESTRHLASARTVAHRLEAVSAQREVTLLAARLADRDGDAGAVLRLLPIARADGGAGTSESGAAEWHLLRSRALARAGRLESAIAEGRQAVAVVNRMRSHLASGHLRAGFAALQSEAHAGLIALLVQEGRLEEAFRIANGVRGQALLEQLSPNTSVGGPTAALVQQEGLLRRIGALTTHHQALERIPAGEQDANSHATATAIAATLADARIEFEALVARQGKLDARLPLLAPDETGTAQIRTSLEPNETLLVYFVAADQTHIFAVTAAGMRHFAQAITGVDLARRVRLARDLVMAGQTASARPVLERLHAVLIAPVARSGLLPPGQRLLIAPHAALGRLPFAALRDSARGRWLVEDHGLLRLTSASALLVLRRAVVPQISPRAALFAPDPDRLPGSAAEIRAIARIHADVRSHLGGAATERSVRAALARRGVVHVAGHGRLNERSPMFSHLELAAGRGTPDDDGRLEVHELLGQDLASDLVFLSGCETGAGAAWTAYDAGEDYATLAQVLHYGGVRNVIASLWSLEDTSAALLAERFYRHLSRLPPPEALAQAQRDLIRRPGSADPRAWAAYQLSGDGRPSGPVAHPR